MLNFILVQQGNTLNKGKALLGMSSRTRRRESRVSNNHDDNQLWEDELVFAGENLRVHTTRWQDPEVLEHWGIAEDFQAFAATTGLLEFSRHPRNTYVELSREFLSTFRFEGPVVHRKSKSKNPPPATFVIKFTMRGQRLVMSLEEFCKAIRVPTTGLWDETYADSREELVTFWRSIAKNIPERMNRGKLTCIQHPGLRYFALFLARGFLARDNTSACTGPMIYLLKCAMENTTPVYNLGTILARTLHLAVSRNGTDNTPLYGGAIATLIHEYIMAERGFNDNLGTIVNEPRLLDFGLLFRMDMSRAEKEYFSYCYKDSNGHIVSVRLPCADLFDRETKWTVQEEPQQEEQQQEEPQYQAPMAYPWGFPEPHLGAQAWQDPSFFQGGSLSGGHDYHPGY